jgi:hypothetical protein
MTSRSAQHHSTRLWAYLPKLQTNCPHSFLRNLKGNQFWFVFLFSNERCSFYSLNRLIIFLSLQLPVYKSSSGFSSVLSQIKEIPEDFSISSFRHWMVKHGSLSDNEELKVTLVFISSFISFHFAVFLHLLTIFLMTGRNEAPSGL